MEDSVGSRRSEGSHGDAALPPEPARARDGGASRREPNIRIRWIASPPRVATPRGRRWDNRDVKAEPAVERPEILRLVGVYDADGTLRGELAYWFGARLGRRHCALCDITHGSLRERKDWRECRGSLGVAFDTVHRDEASADVLAVVRDDLPAVVAVTSEGVTPLLGPRELEACAGSPTSMVEELRRAADRRGLCASWQELDSE